MNPENDFALSSDRWLTCISQWTQTPDKVIHMQKKKTLRLKGQMNPKIDIFSVVALPSPNTKKKHPKWDLGKDFSSQAFIERWKIKIPAFPKTSRKRFWNGRAIDWRLRDVNVSLSGRKNVLRKLLRIPYRLRLFVSFCESQGDNCAFDLWVDFVCSASPSFAGLNLSLIHIWRCRRRG